MAAARPRSSHRVLRAGWVMARAFTPTPVTAALVLPWTVLAVLPGALRGGLFLDPTGTGMVLLSRWRLVLDLLVLLPVMATATAGTTSGRWLIAATAPGALAPLLVLTALLVAAGLAGALFLLPARGGSAVPFGPETPPGPRWEIRTRPAARHPSHRPADRPARPHHCSPRPGR